MRQLITNAAESSEYRAVVRKWDPPPHTQTVSEQCIYNEAADRARGDLPRAQPV